MYPNSSSEAVSRLGRSSDATGPVGTVPPFFLINSSRFFLTCCPSRMNCMGLVQKHKAWLSYRSKQKHQLRYTNTRTHLCNPLLIKINIRQGTKCTFQSPPIRLVHFFRTRTRLSCRDAPQPHTLQCVHESILHGRSFGSFATDADRAACNVILGLFALTTEHGRIGYLRPRDCGHCSDVGCRAVRGEFCIVRNESGIDGRGWKRSAG